MGKVAYVIFTDRPIYTDKSTKWRGLLELFTKRPTQPLARYPTKCATTYDFPTKWGISSLFSSSSPMAGQQLSEQMDWP